SSAHLKIAQFAASQHFVKVPVREEVTRAFTVPASINGHPCRLLVDTGAFVTTFDLRRAKEFGLSFTPTKMSGSFTDGVSRQVGIGQVNNLMIGNYHVPPQKLSGAVLPYFAVEQGHGGGAGIFGAVKYLDAFLMAFRLPNLLRDLFAEGALSTAFITTFSGKIATEGDESAWRLANKVATLTAVFMSAVTLLGIVFAPQLVDL